MEFMKSVGLIAGTAVVVATVTAVTIVYGVPALKRHEQAVSSAGAPVTAAPAPAPATVHRRAVPPPREAYGSGSRQPYSPAPAPWCGNCGIVQSVRRIRVDARPTGGGAILGGIAGAVLGHQLGRGGGKDLATVAGAAGGAFLGNHIEETENAHYVYRVEVLRNSGGVVVLRQPNYVAAGEQVRIEGGRAVRR
ncbi:MAG: glycine zipper 2TM domain-containing protein [Acidiferrobacteraceae bacterium]